MARGGYKRCLSDNPFGERKIADGLWCNIATDECAEGYARNGHRDMHDWYQKWWEEYQIKHVHEIHAIAQLADVVDERKAQSGLADGAQQEEHAEGE